VPALLQPVSLGQLVQGEDAADVRFQLSFVRKLRDRAEDFTLSLEMNAVNSRRAHELKIKRGILAKEFSRDFRRRRAYDGDEPPVDGQAIQRAIKRLSADGIKNDRAAAPARLLVNALREILLRVIDDHFRAELTAQLDRFVSAGRGQDAAAVKFRELDRDVPHSAAARVDQHRLTILHLGPEQPGLPV